MSEFNDFLKLMSEGRKTDPKAVRTAQLKEGIKNDIGDLFEQLASLKVQRDELIGQHPELEEVAKQEVLTEASTITEDVLIPHVVAEALPQPEVSESIKVSEATETPTEIPNPNPSEQAKMDAITKYFPKKTFQQPNPEKPAAELKAITDKIKFLEQWLGRVAAHGPGSGEVNLRYLDDVDRSTIVDGYYLAYNGETKKFEFREVTGTGNGTPQVQSDWTETNTVLKSYIKHKPTLATVATSGSYNDLADQPTIPAAQVNSDWNATTGVAQILHKPTLAAVATSGSYNDLADQPTIPAAQIQSDWGQTNNTLPDYIKNKPDITAIQDVFTATAEPMGHQDRTQSTISFDNSSRTFAITPVGANFVVWVKGTKYTFTTAQSVTLPNTSGLYYIYFNSSGIGYQTSYFTWDQQAMTAYVYYNASTGTGHVFDERHGITLDWQTHEYLHRTHGALYSSGFDVSNYILNGDGSLDTHCQLDLAGGTFFDEDNQIDIVHNNTPTANTFQQDLQGPARIPTFYKSGSNGAWVLDSATDYPMKLGTDRPRYNVNTSGTWSTADIDNNKFGVTFIIATNMINTPIIGVIGQSQHANVGDAEGYNLSQLDLGGFPITEMRVLYRVVYGCKTSYANTPSAIITSIWDLRVTTTTSTNVTTGDHGSLTGLLDDDHPQYLLRTDAAAVATTGLYSSLSGTPTIPSLTGYATETYVGTAINNLINSAPGTLDTLGEIATALQADGSAIGALTTVINSKIGLTSLSVSTATASGSGSLAYNNTNGTFTFTPPVLFSGSYNDLTNKPTFLAPRVSTTSSTTSLTWNSSSYDFFDITNQSGSITIGADSAGASAINGQKVTFRIYASSTSYVTFDNGANYKFKGIGVTLPNARFVATGETLVVGAIYNSRNSLWEVVALTQG